MEPSLSQLRVNFSCFLFVFCLVLDAGVLVVSGNHEFESSVNVTDTLNPITNDSNRMDNFTVLSLKIEGKAPRLQAYQGSESVKSCSCNEELRTIREQWKYESSQRTVMKGALELFATDLMNLKALVNSRIINESTRNKQIKTLADITEVAFSARVSDHLSGLQPQQVIVFDQLITNVGAAYDPSSGVFTCPISGTYQLFATVLSGYNMKVESGLVVNDIEVARLYSGAQHAHGSSTAAVILLLEKGDLASVRVLYQSNSNIHGVYSTFSGYLLRPL